MSYLNSRKKNYNQKKIDRHFTYIDNKSTEYLAQLDRLDKEEERNSERLIRKKDIKKKLIQLKERRINYEEMMYLYGRGKYVWDMAYI